MAGRYGGNGAQRIAMERQRQKGPATVGGEGYTLEHDRGHAQELVLAAACYAIPAERRLEILKDNIMVPVQWPWEPSHWKPSDDRVRDLEKAGALIAAAIDAELEALSG